MNNEHHTHQHCHYKHHHCHMAGVGLQWNNIAHGPNLGETFSMAHVLCMLLVNLFVFGLLTCYFDAVRPGSFGTAQAWYFPFSVGCPSSSSSLLLLRLFYVYCYFYYYFHHLYIILIDIIIFLSLLNINNNDKFNFKAHQLPSTTTAYVLETEAEVSGGQW